MLFAEISCLKYLFVVSLEEAGIVSLVVILIYILVFSSFFPYLPISSDFRAMELNPKQLEICTVLVYFL